MFYIEVKDNEGHTLTLDAFIEIEDEFYDIYIGDTHNGTRYNSCIHLSVFDNEPEAILQDLSYRQSCDINGNLEESAGTRLMLKGALTFIIQKYPFVRQINLSDVAQKKNTRVYLTPKRLLLKKEGWYQQNFGATPTNKTKIVIHNALKSIDFTPDIIERIQQRSWGKQEDLKSLSTDAAKLIHSDWIISKETIENYPITIKIKKHKDSLIGGSIQSHKGIKHKIKRKQVAYTNAELKALTFKEDLRLESGRSLGLKRLDKRPRHQGVF